MLSGAITSRQGSGVRHKMAFPNMYLKTPGTRGRLSQRTIHYTKQRKTTKSHYTPANATKTRHFQNSSSPIAAAITTTTTTTSATHVTNHAASLHITTRHSRTTVMDLITQERTDTNVKDSLVFITLFLELRDEVPFSISDVLWPHRLSVPRIYIYIDQGIRVVSIVPFHETAMPHTSAVILFSLAAAVVVVVVAVMVAVDGRSRESHAEGKNT
ncbi:hypothetical protein E2C01_044489 [Portunus trituberculatus]|uniref:Uncharacterized protein n=1 Tax=Portunus trituberculatus TaxID=210409 RepID=A0A5B7FTA1_PORTR|nr:hypothetical protein [Portunus trituberculatus]